MAEKVVGPSITPLVGVVVNHLSLDEEGGRGFDSEYGVPASSQAETPDPNCSEKTVPQEEPVRNAASGDPPPLIA